MSKFTDKGGRMRGWKKPGEIHVDEFYLENGVWF